MSELRAKASISCEHDNGGYSFKPFYGSLPPLMRITSVVQSKPYFPYFMSTPDSDQQKEETSQSSENIEIPPIPKTTAGAVAGAAVGSIAGPIGAVVGGVAGAVAGRAAKSRRVRQASARTLRKVVSKAKSAAGTAKRQLTTRSGSRSRKKSARSRSAVKRRPSSRSKVAKSRNKARTKRASSSSRASRNRGGSRKKRH